MLTEPGAAGDDSDVGCVRFRVAVHAGGNRGEGDGLATVLPGEVEAMAVTVGQQIRFAVRTVAVDRADGVNDVFRGQIEPGTLLRSGNNGLFLEY